MYIIERLFFPSDMVEGFTIATEAVVPVAYEPVRIPVRTRLVCGARERLCRWLTIKQGFD